jgi:phage terminase large subunit
VSAQSWIKKEVEDKPQNRDNAVRISKTARDNKFVDQSYLNALEKLKDTNPAKHKIYALNMW